MRRIQYRFALNPEGRVIDVHDLARETDRPAFVCIGCGARLVAHLKDDRRARHFAHYRVEQCAPYETYLHRAAKATFLQTYRDCVAAPRPFLVRVPVEDACDGLSGKLGVTCVFPHLRDLDLTQVFHQAALEQPHEGFVADVLLSGERTRRVLFIEILVTHACEPAKIASGHRILELRITSDEDIAALRTGLIPTGAGTPHVAHNFRVKPLRGAFCEGQCRRRAAVFVVYPSGRVKLFHDKPAERVADFKPATAIWRKVLIDFEEAPPYASTNQLEYVGTDLPPGDSLEQRAAIEAVSHGVKVRTCEVCRRQGSPSFNGLWCFAYRESVHPSRAAECAEFASVRSVAELAKLRERNAQSRARRFSGK